MLCHPAYTLLSYSRPSHGFLRLYLINIVFKFIFICVMTVFSGVLTFKVPCLVSTSAAYMVMSFLCTTSLFDIFRQVFG